MKNQLINDGTVVYFALAVNGKIVSPKFSERYAAEIERAKLPKEQQAVAEVVTVDAANRQLLLG